ncbi:hypothetical protein BDR04DRAFT_734649 [Suillus decipiens]|nr:hypothetical protein BDR04DRAFT_734649 [Suillus decipiens]
MRYRLVPCSSRDSDHKEALCLKPHRFEVISSLSEHVDPCPFHCPLSMTAAALTYNADVHIRQSASSITFATPSMLKQVHLETDPRFAFARVKGDIYLVRLHPIQSNTSRESLGVVVFRHEFVSIFRYSHNLCVSPEDIRVLELLDEDQIRYEEDNGTVFLAKDLMTQLRRMIDASNMVRLQRGRQGHRRRSN